ncbi:transcription repressor NadR [Marinilactibacillus kalidii]|uniref:transcription repressor NadR n=1 Tax=Marinilactibacillus kalidii TaxID=2820274 RepID=UPI001ABDDD7E|nr:transcription repressor NadR [Marinilactibacillus kalidii]
MDAEIRREQILAILSKTDEPIIARKLAEQFTVSRQVIVGDIALLRAEGHDILSTPKGYIKKIEMNRLTKRIVCQHNYDQTLEELFTIVDHGGEILDVIVEHAIYGEIVGGLNISNRMEATAFLEKLNKNHTSLLADLTDGLHSHTISAKDEVTLAKIVEALEKKNLIYK